jgi:ATP-dependent helicase HepA
VLAEREAQARERYGHDLQEAKKRRAVEESFGLYRRLIRTARTDYPDVLPKRNYQPIKIAPTDGDVERARATRSYLYAARDSNPDIRREARLQVAGRSPSSLRDRISTPDEALLTSKPPGARLTFASVMNRETPSSTL